mmetsp:Transcript_29845/g.95459  ORF Transcript_29845/g.95459 Transcript_29845/m.95459 type:complete len:212 (+) Transcript_29845:1076-1711(+)
MHRIPRLSGCPSSPETHMLPKRFTPSTPKMKKRRQRPPTRLPMAGSELPSVATMACRPLRVLKMRKARRMRKIRKILRILRMVGLNPRAAPALSIMMPMKLVITMKKSNLFQLPLKYLLGWNASILSTHSPPKMNVKKKLQTFWNRFCQSLGLKLSNDMVSTLVMMKKAMKRSNLEWLITLNAFSRIPDVGSSNTSGSFRTIFVGSAAVLV